jgi:hypothetical protein
LKDFDTKHALLTKTELNWLQGKKFNISASFEYKIKSQIRKKLRILSSLELPLLEKSGIFSDDLTLFGKSLTIYGKAEYSINSSKNGIQSQNMVGREGLTLFLMWFRKQNRNRKLLKIICN